MRSWEDVHRLRYRENRSGREIARILHMSRNTVSRLLAMPEPPCVCRSSCSKLDPFRPRIIFLLQHDPAMPATVVHRRLKELGYEGGLTLVKEFVSTIRRQSGPVAVPRPSLHPVTGAAGPRSNDASSAPEVDCDPPLLGLEIEPGMNLISADFDIIMVNRVNERLFKKPMVELLGKKCYREFERRSNVCPHCPGLAALTTGQPHQVESTGIRDDGTKYLVRLTAHPIVAPNGEPAGFVEVEEDITERKLSEGLAELVEDLQASLAATHDVTGAVRQALKVAFSLEGVDFGCAYVWDAATAGYRAVAQRGVSRRSALEDVAGAESKAIELIPIVHDGLTVGRLLIGSSTYYEFPPATHAALEALGTIVEGAVANLQALQLERETRSDVEALLLSLPVPVWCTDGEHRVTLWNRAAEQVFGWTAAEVVRSELPLQLLEAAPETDEVVCRAKDGTSLRLRTTTLRPPRALGARRRTMTMAVHVEPVDPPSGTASDGHSPPPTSNEAAPPIAAMPAKKRGRAGSAHPPRLLVVQESSFDRRILAATLRAQDCSVTMCRDGPTAVAKYESALGSSRRYSLVITELLASGCMGGLELASMLHRCDPHARVVLTSDSSIVGFESHGLAGALRRPYEPEAVRRMLVELLDTC